MAFEKYIPDVVKATQPRARIRPSGLISFDAFSVEKFDLGKTKNVVLFFDKTKKQIGVKTAASPNEEGSLPVSKRRQSINVKAPGFFAHYAFVIDRPLVINVQKNDEGMLILDMSSIKRKRGKRRKIVS